MKNKGKMFIASASFTQIFLIISMSFGIAFLLSQEVGTVSGIKMAPTPVKSPSGGTGLWGGIKNVAGGKAFPAAGGGASVGGALVQGVFWAGVLYLASKAIFSMLGVKKETADAASTALFAGALGFGVTKAAVLGLAKTKTFMGLSPGATGFLGGAAIAAVVFIAMYKKQKKQIVNFECLPWEPPLGGKSCEECNKDPLRPCSEYRCKSLGQGCQLLNPGTGKEQCAWVSKFDVESPIIKPWTEPLRPIDAKYVPDTSVRPPALGVKVVRGTNGCLDAFTPLQFGITTNEPAQCKVDYNHTQKFDEMQFYLGGENYYKYNHTQTMRLPGPDAEADAPLLSNDGTFSLYVRCRDGNGNENVDEYSVSFCVNKGPDTTPPVIEKTSINTDSFVRFKVDSVPIEVYTNEPAECKWSRQSKNFADMENSMTCAEDVSDINSDLLYTCSGNLTGVKDKEDNVFYFRCKDQPGKDEKERNVMVQSYELNLRGSQPITIDRTGPNGTIFGSTTAVNVTLEVETSSGSEEGKSTCYFSETGASGSYIEMFETGTYLHRQELDIGSGNYTYFFRCIDAGGNSAEGKTEFLVKVDKGAPMVTRVYRDDALKIVTDEDAECRYSLNSCNFPIAEGLRMEYINADEKNKHFAEWKSGVAYYIKCMDSYGNEPAPDECSIVARPTQYGEEAKSVLDTNLGGNVVY